MKSKVHSALHTGQLFLSHLGATGSHCQNVMLHQCFISQIFTDHQALSCRLGNTSLNKNSSLPEVYVLNDSIPAR